MKVLLTLLIEKLSDGGEEDLEVRFLVTVESRNRNRNRNRKREKKKKHILC